MKGGSVKVHVGVFMGFRFSDSTTGPVSSVSFVIHNLITCSLNPFISGANRGIVWYTPLIHFCL